VNSRLAGTGIGLLVNYMAVNYATAESNAGVFNPVFSSISVTGTYTSTRTGASGLTRSGRDTHSESTGFTNDVASSQTSKYGETYAYNFVTRDSANTTKTGLSATTVTGEGRFSYMRSGSVGKGQYGDSPEQSTTYEPHGISYSLKNTTIAYNYNKLKDTTVSYDINYPKTSFSTETSVSFSNTTAVVALPYNKVILTTSSKFTASKTSTVNTFYSSSYRRKTYDGGTDGTLNGVEAKSEKNNKFEDYYFKDVVFKTNSIGFYPAQLWVYKNGTGVISDCFSQVKAGNYTLQLPRVSSSRNYDVITYTDPEGTSNEYDKSVSSIQDFKLNNRIVTYDGYMFATYSTLTETGQIGLGPAPGILTAINGNVVEDIQTSINDVIYYEVSILSKIDESYSYSYSLGTTTNARTFDYLYTTKAYSFPQVFSKTVNSKIEKPWVLAIQTSSSDEANWTIRGGGGETRGYGASTDCTIRQGFYTLPYVKLLEDNPNFPFAFTCKTLPDGFIGFAGTFDESFTTKKEAYRSIVYHKQGNLISFKNAVEFNLFDLESKLFAQIRKNGTVIIPKTYHEFEDFTVSAEPPKRLTTSAEFSVYYSTTVQSTRSTRVSTNSKYKEYGITKTRGSGLEFTTGLTSTEYTYSVSAYSITNTTNTIETVITYEYSVTDKKNKDYFTTGIANTTCYAFTYDDEYAPLMGHAVTYGMVGGVGFGNCVMEVGPILLKYTLANADGRTAKSKISFSNVSKKRLLTIKEDQFMYFEAIPIYTTHKKIGYYPSAQEAMDLGYWSTWGEYINYYDE